MGRFHANNFEGKTIFENINLKITKRLNWLCIENLASPIQKRNKLISSISKYSSTEQKHPR